MPIVTCDGHIEKVWAVWEISQGQENKVKEIFVNLRFFLLTRECKIGKLGNLEELVPQSARH